MAVLNFNDLEFVDEKERIKVYFLKIYYFYLQKEDLSRIGSFKISHHSIEFNCSEKKASNKFNQLLQKGFENLICTINKAKTVYVHKNSGIPLVGTGVFGLIDRNTNCIEVKPLTVCNLDCVFCSVDAGLSSRKTTGYVIEKDYLIEEFNNLIKEKKLPVEAHIGPQGEPLLYAPLVELVKDLKKNPNVKIVSMDTNGILLTKKLIDDLAQARLTRFNISLNALDEKKCKTLAGTGYNLKHLLEMIKYAGKKTNVLIAPVIVPSFNDDEIENLVNIGKELDSEFPVVGVQNFLNYKRGRNPVKQRSWEEFFKMLESFEKKTGVKLRLSEQDFGIGDDTKQEKPFKKKQIVKARVVCRGPLKGEMIAAYKNRAIIVDKSSDSPINSDIKATIIRDKHNIFRGIKK